MRIKTICEPNENFDTVINDFLSQGWKILDNSFRISKGWDDSGYDEFIESTKETLRGIGDDDPEIQEFLGKSTEEHHSEENFECDVYIIILYQD